MLTNADAKAARPRARGYKLHDEAGLHLYVAPSGRKSWRLAFRWPRGSSGAEQLLTFGRFPELSLAQARLRRDAARAQLGDGIDPRLAMARARSFEQLARAWHAHNAPAWSPAHAADVLAGLERDIFPAIGARPIGEIEPPELLELLRAIERRGRVETARRMRQRLAEIFAYGLAEGLAATNPAASLGAALLEPPPARPQPALERIEDCRALLAACELAAARPATRLASRFLALTAVRLDAVRGLRWCEVDLNVNSPTWTVPAARMKLKRSKKGEAAFDHVVPLSAAAVAVLREAAELVADNKQTRGPQHENGYHTHSLVFPGRSAEAPIGEGTIGELYDRCGFAGRHVPHGWRASFSTILNEDLGEDWARTIDRALAHSPKDRVEAAYNRAQLLDRRRHVLERWAELLTAPVAS